MPDSLQYYKYVAMSFYGALLPQMLFFWAKVYIS